MCGICGVLDFRASAGATDVVEAMMGTMTPRGPDARGVHHDGPVTLGHLRLSIIDLDPRSHQPMIDHRGRAIVFNGEIYNYRSLRRSLADRWSFGTESDTEVILAAYDAWGPDCVRRFIGDWAFAIHDPTMRQLVLSRDRVGVKPLYYAFHDGRLLFASEVRALVAGGLPGEVTRQQIITFVVRGENEPGPQTMVRGGQALLPANTMVVGHDGRRSCHEYWGEQEIFGQSVPGTFAEATEAYAALFEDSVRLRLHADVPVGVCLSGGIDSSLITAVASRIPTTPVMTFSGVAPRFESDEGPHSDAVAAEHRTRHARIELRFDDFLDALGRFVRAQDSPAGGISALARLQVLERASEDVTVVLDGQGGDELQAGYHRYHELYRQMRPHVELTMQPKAGRERSRHRTMDVFERDFAGSLKARPRHEPRWDTSLDPVTELQYRNLRGPGLLCLLHTEDRLTMSRSMEGRVPFLDHRLIEFCLSAPLEYRIDDVDKRLSRAMARERELLPPSIVERRDKRGFATPYAEIVAVDESARSAVARLIAELTERVPGIFDRSVLAALLEEHDGLARDRTRRIFRALTILMYLEQTGYRVVG